MTTLTNAITTATARRVERAVKQPFTAKQKRALRIADRVAKKNAELLRRLA